METRHPAALTLIHLFALTACGGDMSVSAGAGADVRDSAGVVIVEYPGSVRDLPFAFRIDPTPGMNLGGQKENPVEELDARAPFQDAVRFPDGRWVVPDFNDLKVFDAQGRHLYTVGGPGEGPGEFRQVRGACAAPGDTLVAIHYATPNVSVFAPGGAHVRSFTVPGGGYVLGGCLEDGSVLVSSDTRSDPEGTALDRVSTLTRVGMDGTLLGAVGTFVAGSTSSTIQTIPNVVPHDGRLYVGNGTRPEIRIYRLDGSLERIVRWTEPRVPVTAEVIEEMVRSMMPLNAPPGQYEAALERARTQPNLSELPVYALLQVDAAGRIWVQDHYSTSEFPFAWTVFDPSGQPLGRVALPEVPGSRGVELRSIGRDEVVLVWRDEELGFAHVTFHALEPVEPVP